MIPGFPIHLGYCAIFVLMVVSPIPPEVFIPTAGFLVSQGELNFWLVVLVGTLSFIVSILPWYLLGRFIRRWGIQKLPRRYQKWLSLTPERLERSSQWFRKKGRAALLTSFLLPGMRNLVWIPAGISGMRVPVALLNAGVGSFIYLLVMTSAGLLLGNQYYLVKQYFASVYHLVFLVLAIALVIEGSKSYVRRRRSRRKQQALR